MSGTALLSFAQADAARTARRLRDSIHAVLDSCAIVHIHWLANELRTRDARPISLDLGRQRGLQPRMTLVTKHAVGLLYTYRDVYFGRDRQATRVAYVVSSGAFDLTRADRVKVRSPDTGRETDGVGVGTAEQDSGLVVFQVRNPDVLNPPRNRIRLLTLNEDTVAQAERNLNPN